MVRTRLCKSAASESRCAILTGLITDQIVIHNADARANTHARACAPNGASGPRHRDPLKQPFRAAQISLSSAVRIR
jgi:hypothetical protein